MKIAPPRLRMNSMAVWQATLAFVALLLFLSVVSGSTVGRKLESSFGAPVVFQMRNALQSPAEIEEVLVITPFRTRKPSTPNQISDWNRKEHASAIDALVRLGARTIAIDLFFRRLNTDNRASGDAALVNSISAAPSLILNQDTSAISVGTQDIVTDVVQDPANAFAREATRLAPALVAATSSRANRAFLLKNVYHEPKNHQCFGFPVEKNLQEHLANTKHAILTRSVIPTLPVVVLEEQLGLQFAKKQLTEHYPKFSSVAGSINNTQPCIAWQALRRFLFDNTTNSKPIPVAGSNSDRLFARWHNIHIPGNAWWSDESGSIGLSVNYYGPPATLPTRDYGWLQKHEKEVHAGVAENLIRGRAVFIGGSFVAADDQKGDAFATVFSNYSSPMSGVEVKASVYLNLIRSEQLREADAWWAPLATFIMGLSILLLGGICHTRPWLLATLLLFSTYFCASVLILSTRQILAPVAAPMLACTLLCAALVLWRLRIRSQERDRARTHLAAFLSDTVASQLDSDNNHVLRDAICIVTDIRNFTAVGSTLDPSALHQLNHQYFSMLFSCVSRAGADVIKTYGDSMTAVWTSRTNDTELSAVHAGLALLDAVNDFNAKHPGTPFVTNIGLSCGQVAVGYVGDGPRRTVELTGSTVYLASRLEQLNKGLHSRFLTTADVADRLVEIQSRMLGEQTIKGYQKPVDVVEIESYVQKPLEHEHAKALL